MFTGLIQKIGKIKHFEQRVKSLRITISHDQWDLPLSLGESIAVDGACFTITACGINQFSCDSLDETLRRTNLFSRKPESKVNLERALRVGDAIGGHFVTGHVDGVARVVSIRESDGDTVLCMECDEDLMRGVILKGSIACNGVSLTISRIVDSGFEARIIPFTWVKTNFSLLAPDDPVNIETDIIGKYVFRRSEHSPLITKQLEMDDLMRAGFLAD